MSKISVERRTFEIKKKRKRKEKIKKMQERYKKAKSEKEKQEIIKKFIKIASHLNPRQYLKD